MQTKTSPQRQDPKKRLMHIGGKVAAGAVAGAVGAAVPPVRQETGHTGDTAHGQGSAGLGETHGKKELEMKLQSATYTAKLEPRCPETGCLVAEVLGYSHAHSYGDTEEDLLTSLKGALAMTLEEENPGVEIDHLRLNIVLS